MTPTAQPRELTERCPGLDGCIDLREQARLLYRKWSPQIAQHFADFSSLVGEDTQILEELAQIGIRNPRLLYHAWRQRLMGATQQERLLESVVCGFSACVDTVCPVEVLADHTGRNKDNWKLFLLWVAEREGKEASAVLEEAQQIANTKAKSLQNTTIKKHVNMLAALLAAMKDPAGVWKPRVHEDLMEDVVKFFGDLQDQGRTFRWPGGGAGNMSWVLRNLGCPTAGTWLYHFDELADMTPYCLKYIRFEPSGGIEIVPASRKGAGAPHPGQQWPMRLSFAIEFSKGFGGGFEKYGVTHVAVGQGRVVFVFRDPVDLSGQPRSWSRIVFRKYEAGSLCDYVLSDPKHIKKCLGRKGWPFVPVFCSWTREGDALVIHLASDGQMAQVAGVCDYFLMGGIQGLGNDLFKCRTRVDGGEGPMVQKLLLGTLRSQLSVLSKAGVTVHWEVGHVSSVELLDLLVETMRGVIHSASLNHTELNLLSSHRGYPYSHKQFTTDLTKRYHQADFIARWLGLRELYVHGNEADIILRRAASCGELRYELIQGLFTKTLILAALMFRTSPDWFSSAPECPSVLSLNGLLEMLKFAFELGGELYPGNGQHVFESLARFGYLHRPGDQAYSVVTIPVVWPELMRDFSTVGAGDISSAVLTVFAGK